MRRAVRGAGTRTRAPKFSGPDGPVETFGVRPSARGVSAGGRGGFDDVDRRHNFEAMNAGSSQDRRQQPTAVDIPAPPLPGAVAVLCCQTLIRFVTTCPELARRISAVFLAWGVPCLPLPPDTSSDVVAEVYGVREQVHAVTAIATAGIAFVWHPDQSAQRRTATLHGFPIAAPPDRHPDTTDRAAAGA